MPDFDVDTITGDLRQIRHHWRDTQRPPGDIRGIEFPSRETPAAVVGELKGLLGGTA